MGVLFFETGCNFHVFVRVKYHLMLYGGYSKFAECIIYRYYIHHNLKYASYKPFIVYIMKNYTN